MIFCNIFLPDEVAKPPTKKTALKAPKNNAAIIGLFCPIISKVIITNSKTHDGTAITITHPFVCILQYFNKFYHILIKKDNKKKIILLLWVFYQ